MVGNIPEINAMYKPDFQLSASKPIHGLIVRHPDKRGCTWDMHYSLEFGVVCSGQERRYFPGKHQFPVGPGQVWFCDMWEPHGAAITHAPCECIVLFIWPPFLAQLHFDENPDFHGLAPFIASPKLRPQTPPQLRQTLRKYGWHLRAILKNNSPYQQLFLRLVFLEILLKLCEPWQENKRCLDSKPSEHFTRIYQALQLVFDKLRFVSAEEAARTCGMERHAFGRLFKAWMNVSFAEFALRYRLSIAAAQLVNTNEPIKSITLRCGFTDESHFCRTFERYYRFPPHSYREKIHAKKQNIQK